MSQYESFEAAFEAGRQHEKNEHDCPLAHEVVHLRYKTNAGEDREYFDSSTALAWLLAHDHCFINSRHWREHDKGDIAVCVNCNDVFAWGCSDAEDLPFDQVQPLYEMVRRDPQWGAAMWCILRRKEMPQPPVERAIRKAGIWNLDQHGLGENVTDAWAQSVFAQLAAQLNSKETP